MTSFIAHGDLAFHNPLSPARVDAVLALCELSPAAAVLDIGCGPGELLIRAAEASGCGGLGLDLDDDAIHAARERAASRGVDVTFEVADTRAAPPSGAWDLVACFGSMHAIDGGFDALRALAKPGGWVLRADGFWRQRPSAAYLKALGDASEDECADLATLAEDAAYMAVTTDEEWDRYEWTLIHNQLRFAHDHPDDPRAPAARQSAARARARWAMDGGRDTLGFALVLHRVD